MLGGEIEIITDSETKKALWQDGWEIYYPQGVCDQDYVLLCLRPNLARYYDSLSSVEFKFPTHT